MLITELPNEIIKLIMLNILNIDDYKKICYTNKIFYYKFWLNTNFKMYYIKLKLNSFLDFYNSIDIHKKCMLDLFKELIKKEFIERNNFINMYIYFKEKLYFNNNNNINILYLVESTKIERYGDEFINAFIKCLNYPPEGI